MTDFSLNEGELAAVVKSDGSLSVHHGPGATDPRTLAPENKAAFTLVMAMPFLLTDAVFVEELRQALVRGGFQ